MATPAKKGDRDCVLHEITRSLCPECGRVVDAQVLIRDGNVTMRRRCPLHGWHEALISSDADWYLKSLKYDKPGAIPHHYATSVREGCPFDCGLCPKHQQHTCVGVIEITNRCNLECPTCFADSGLARSDRGHDLSLAQVEAILDRFLETEGQPEVVQISGGEPTIHPQLLEILAAAKARDIRHVMLNTNGLRLAQDAEFVDRLAHYEPVIYLQFDGLRASTYEELRGLDLRAVKEEALEHLAEAGLHAMLVPTVVRGVNEDEIGDILRFGLNHPAVVGINYQPVTFAGRCLNHRDPFNRITLPDVLHALETQTEGLFQVSDFFPVPCPHPTCSACTYAFLHGDEVIPIPRTLNVDDYLDFISNRTLPDLSAEIEPVVESLWSMAAVMGSDKTTDNLVCATCGIEAAMSLDPEHLKEHFFAIQVHGFMDEHSFDLKRLMKCCVHQLLPDGRAVPFCAYNNLGYREEVRETLGKTGVSCPQPKEVLA
ncbi:MAG: radical SAM protein [Chloroflexi bacterium B3_Chlor]|nr:MAG: radical SAM protein [Chloroflexi bacterium B3_Chlor]